MYNSILSAMMAIAFSFSGFTSPQTNTLTNDTGVVIVKSPSYQAEEKITYTATNLSSLGLYPLDETMKAAGYIKNDNLTYSYKDINTEILISFDLDNKVCKKNSYEFNLSDGLKDISGTYYISEDLISSILCGTVKYQKNILVFNPTVYAAHDWCEFPKLVAHAGGGVREKSHISRYTNSLEALIENYNLGHRVFEFDFYLTSDDKLAVVHDWDQFGYKDGTFLSAQEWLDFDSPYTTMMVEDVLDEMLVNKDMFVVTDTKSTEFTEEQAHLQFQLICDEAIKRDPKLLDRIIPQVYNEEHYEMVMSIYPFRSVIYTIYANGKDFEDRIVSFAISKPNIHVITAPIADHRLNEKSIRRIHENGMLVYTHTIDTYEQLMTQASRGIDGFYTDILTPADLNEYYSSVK